MSDTPETDVVYEASEVAFCQDYVLKMHGERLERQRDEAINAIKKFCDVIHLC